MRIALAAVGFMTGDVQYNKNKLTEVLRACRGRADLVLFGEMFLQGFDCLCWDSEKDRATALAQDSPVMREIQNEAAKNGIAVSFGYAERNGGSFYSSQMTVGLNGEPVDHYRRISPGWKVPEADGHYREGDGFHSFTFEGHTFAAALCGDLWYDENAAQMHALQPDAVLWPVYTDYKPDEWNSSLKREYAEQAGRAGEHVLLVNSVCMDGSGIARGGAAYFRSGSIAEELPSGEEGLLIVQIP